MEAIPSGRIGTHIFQDIIHKLIAFVSARTGAVSTLTGPLSAVDMSSGLLYNIGGTCT